MQNALIVGSRPRRVVFAHELREWDEQRVKATDFHCCGCPVPMVAKAVRFGMKKQAHFATWQGHTHIKCDLTDEVAAPDGETTERNDELHREVIWPNRYVEREPRKIKDPSDELDDGPDQRRQSQPPASKEAGTTNGVSSSTVGYSIGVFAAAYLAMTDIERRLTPIELPGINDAPRYQYAFKQLPQWSIERFTYPRRVFHGPLRYTGDITTTNTGAIHIELYAGGGYDPATKRLSTPWTVVIAPGALTPRQLADLRNQFDNAATTAQERSLAPHVFALATQNPATPHELLVTKRGHIAFLPAHK